MKELNQLRNKAFLGNAVGITILVIGFLIIMCGFPLGLFFIFTGIAIVIIINATFTKQFKEKYKNSICKEVLEKMFDIYEYRPMKGFDEEFVRRSYFIQTGNKFSSDDYILGSYQGIDFERSDITMQDVRSNGKTTTTVTLFEGSWTIFTFPKKISSYLLIREREFLSNSKPGGFFSNAPTTYKVKFEDIDFNDRFDVFASDEHDAFYVCTPHFIEKIKELEARFEGRCIIGIVNQKVHILFDDRKNRMEPSLWSEVNEQDYRNVENEMRMIIEIIEIFKYFLKEREDGNY